MIQIKRVKQEPVMSQLFPFVCGRGALAAPQARRNRSAAR